MKNLKINSVTIGGNVSSVDIKPSTNKPGEFFGSASVAYDDGYFDKNNNNQWVEKTSFIDIKFDNRVIGTLKDGLNKGDQIIVEGKLVVDKWKDQTNGANRSAMKVKAERVVAQVTKTQIECLKTNGLKGNQQQQAGGFQQQQPQQTGGFNPLSNQG